MQEHIGQVIKQLRLEARLSQQELAAELYTKAYVSQVEKGKVRPSKKALQHFAEVLNKPFLAGMGAETTTEYQRIIALLDFSHSLVRQGRIDDAIIQFRQAMAISDEFRYPALKVKALVGLSQAHVDIANYDQAGGLAKEANRLAKQLGEPVEAATTWLQLGIVYHQRQEFQDATAAFESGIELVRNAQDPDGRAIHASLLTSLGQLLTRVGYVDRAIATFHEGVSLAEQLNKLEEQAKCYMGIGMAYYGVGNYYEAMINTQRSMTIYKLVDNTQVKGELLFYLATAEAKLGKDTDAYKHFQESLALQTSKSAQRALEVLLEMAKLKLKQNDLNGAKGILYEANEQMPQQADNEQRAKLGILQGQVEAADGHLENAVLALTQAIDCLDGTDNKRVQAAALVELAKIYRQLGRLEESLASYERSSQLLKETGSI